MFSTGQRVKVSDQTSKFFGHSGMVLTVEGRSYSVYLDARPVGSPAIDEFPPLFRASQLRSQNG